MSTRSGPSRIEIGTLNHAALIGVKAAVEYIASWGEGESLRERIVSAMNGIAGYEHEVGAVPDRDWDPQPRGPDRGEGGGRVHRLLGGGGEPAGADRLGDERHRRI